MTITADSWLRRISFPLLGLILLGGLTLRVWNLNFDRGIGSHPDERSTACFYAPTIALPASWAEFWDPQSSPLNPLWDRQRQEPRSFTYGHFPLYLGVAMGQLFEQLAPAAQMAGVPQPTVELMQRGKDSCDAIAVAGRLSIALLDTLTIFFLFLLGKDFFGRAAGLLAAAFYAFAVQAIQLSHFFAMDPASTTFTVLAVWGGTRMLQRRDLSVAFGTGAACGLAIASKFSALPVLGVPAVAALLVIGRAAQQSRQDGHTLDGRIAFAASVQLMVAWAAALALFFVASPYAVLDWDTFSRAVLVEQGMMVRGVADLPFTRQYRNTPPYLYFIQQQLQWGLGWPLGMVALIGTLSAGWMALRTAGRALRSWFQSRHPGTAVQHWFDDVQLANWVVWSWVFPYFLITGAFLAKFNRYMSPLLPFVLLWGAGAIVLLWRQGARPGPAVLLRWGALGLGAVGLLGGIFWSLAYVNGVYHREHTWIQASRWIYANVPPGSVLLWELWDDPLPKSIPGEAGLDPGSAGLLQIDWSPYEEDTFDKYQILKQKLREADWVIYSSKRIYDSVDELPERYPMTTLYYKAMWDGRLGFELAKEVTSPPQLFGFVFDDRKADESFSLYDHPQVTIFRKVRDLDDAEFDALFGRSWEKAIPYYRGADSPFNPFLEALGLGNLPGSEQKGLLNSLLQVAGVTTGNADVGQRPSLLLDTPIQALPVVDNYRWNRLASEETLLAIFCWWAVLTVLGWSAWPLFFGIFRPLRDAGFWFSRTLGWLLGGWLLWLLTSLGLFSNTVAFAWLSLGLVVLAGAGAAALQRRALLTFVRAHWRSLLVGEGIFAAALLGFVWIRLQNPDLWQPWFGGEKQMEFAFLNGILRSPSFPPVNPHFAGGFINYYYFGIYLVAYLIKLTGIYAEVSFNLAIATLFALTAVNLFAVAYSAVENGRLGRRSWYSGLGAALLAPLYVTILGNLDGFAQWVRNLARLQPAMIQSALPGLSELVGAWGGLQQVLSGRAALPDYDFWGPSRVIESTINEFPFWSFLFADLHPHLIGIPVSVLFLGLTLALIAGETAVERTSWKRGVGMLALFALLLGALASVNLWELPTYFGLGVLALLVSQFRSRGRISWWLTLWIALCYAGGAYLLFFPFFQQYVNVGASGIGWVQKPDPLDRWLLVWGFFLFVLLSGLVYLAAGRPGRPPRPAGIERALSLFWRRYDDLPRLLFWHAHLVERPGFLYLLLLSALPFALGGALLAWLTGWRVLAICLAGLGLGGALLWRRAGTTDAGAALAVLLAVTGMAILAGTQVVYLKDFLNGSDYYRMNTLFKFFSQVWVLWGLAAAIVTPRLWRSIWHGAQMGWPAILARGAWLALFVCLVLAGLAYPLLGTPARLDQRMPGWRPAIGTLNGLDFMREGAYSWPDPSHVIELRYEWQALQWVLETIRGNAVILESAEVEYYRAWGTRIASNSGLSGLRGMHEQEQRYPEDVGYRDGLHRELWQTSDIVRTQQILEELHIDLVYIGQLERYLHPDGVRKFEEMAAQGLLELLFQNERAALYARPGRLQSGPDGTLQPAQPYAER